MMVGIIRLDGWEYHTLSKYKEFRHTSLAWNDQESQKEQLKPLQYMGFMPYKVLEDSAHI